MTQYKLGDSVGDCPACNGQVIFNGELEAACNGCGQMFEISFDEGEEFEEPPKDSVQQPAPPVVQQPAPQQPTQQQTQRSAPQQAARPAPQQTQPLVQQQDQERPIAAPVLDQDPTEMGSRAGTSNLGLTETIFKSKPWQWAQILHRTGNPYREGSKMAKTYDLLVDCELTIIEIFQKAMSIGLFDKISYILTVYEMLTHCVGSGLIIHDEKTKKFTVCKKQPVPARVP